MALAAVALMLGVVVGVAAVVVLGLPPAHALGLEPLELVYQFGPYGKGPGEFGTANGVAFGPGGIMAVGDPDNGRIQVFHANGTYAFHIGPMGAYGVDFGPGGIIVAGSYPSIQVFHANGTFAYEFGSRGFTPGTFLRPNGVAFGPGGIIAVADILSYRVQVFHPNGTFAYQVGVKGPDVRSPSVRGGGSGPGEFYDPTGVDFGPGGIIAVADSGNHRVQVFHPNGTFDYQIGGNGSGWRGSGNGTGEFSWPRSVAFGPGGIIAVADSGNDRVQVFHPNGTYAFHFETASAYNLWGVAFGPGGIIAVADASPGYGGGNRVQVFGPPPAVAPPAVAPPAVAPPSSLSFTGGTFAFEFGSLGSGPGNFMAPRNVAFGPGGFMAVADTGNHRVQVFNPNGTFVFALGLRGEGPGEFYWPEGLAFGPGGLLAVADMGNNRVQVFRLQ